jgi:hypothetical protein
MEETPEERESRMRDLALQLLFTVEKTDDRYRDGAKATTYEMIATSKNSAHRPERLQDDGSMPVGPTRFLHKALGARVFRKFDAQMCQ